MTKTDNPTPVQFPKVDRIEEAAQPSAVAPDKKVFVEPEVSFPIDVLEATTFFALTDSGVAVP